MKLLGGGGGGKLTGWGKNGPAYFFPGERMGRPILSPGKKLTGGKFRPVTPVSIQSQFDGIKKTYSTVDECNVIFLNNEKIQSKVE